MDTTPRSSKSRLVALVAAAMLMLSLAAVPASAQTQEGLVNVNVSDVTIQAPIALAANLCNIAVNALAEQVRSGDTDCDADAESDAVFDPGQEDGDAPTQEGLVNVNVSDVVVQLPISIAANVCDVAVNVLARQMGSGDATCDADADSDADGNG